MPKMDLTMAASLKCQWTVCMLMLVLICCTKCEKAQDFNFLVYKFNRTILQEGVKYVDHLNLSQFIQKELPISHHSGGVDITITKLRIQDIEGENFSFDFPGDDKFTFQGGFTKLSVEAYIIFAFLNQPVTFTVDNFEIETEFYVAYTDGEANFKVRDCSLTIGTIKVDDNPAISMLESILVSFIEKQGCKRIENYFQSQLKLLRARTHLTFFRGMIDEEFYLKATKLTIDKEYITLVETVYDAESEGREVKYTEPYSFVPSLPDKEHAMYLVVGQGMFSTLVKQHMKAMYSLFDKTVKKYFQIHYLYYYIPETRRIFPNATLDIKHLHHDFDIEITPEWILLKANVMVEFIANITCSGKQGSYPVLTVALDLDIPMQVSFNDSMIKLTLKTIRGNITVINSTVGPVNSTDLRRDLNMLPKVFYSSLFYKVNANISAFSTKPLEHLPDELYVTDVNVTLLKGMIVIEESIRFEADHQPITNQTLSIVGGKHSIYDAAVDVYNDPTNSERQKDKPHTCDVSRAIGVHSSVIVNLQVILFIYLSGKILWNVRCV